MRLTSLSEVPDVAKILVVEDNPDAREFLTTFLRLKRFKVVVASNGREGIERARAESPDLIITDLMMPSIPGLEMIRKLRAMKEFKHTPILALTAYGMEKAIEALRAGANRSLARPIENHLLLSFVSDLLQLEA